MFIPNSTPISPELLAQNSRKTKSGTRKSQLMLLHMCLKKNKELTNKTQQKSLPLL